MLPFESAARVCERMTGVSQQLEQHKETIADLYIVQQQPLSIVRKHMKDEHGLSAT
jgi:hypothetical protein